MKAQIYTALIFMSLNFYAMSQDKVYTIEVEKRNEAIGLNNKAIKLIYEKKYDDAISVLLLAVRKDSLLRENYFELFKTAVITKNTSDSILNCLKKGKRIFNDDDEMCFFIGEIYRMKSLYIEAISEYGAAIEFSKQITEKSFYFIDFFKSRAFCNSKLKNYAEAITDYNFVIATKPNDDSSYLNRGICYSNSGKKNHAIIDFRKALELGNQNAMPLIKALSK